MKLTILIQVNQNDVLQEGVDVKRQLVHRNVIYDQLRQNANAQQRGLVHLPPANVPHIRQLSLLSLRGR